MLKKVWGVEKIVYSFNDSLLFLRKVAAVALAH